MLQNDLLPIYQNIRRDRLSPIIKWAGGKEAELKYILPNIPPYFDRYFEPFVGGGAVFFSLNCREMLINDKSSELMKLYSLVQQSAEEFFNKLNEINHNWRLLDQIVERYPELLTGLYHQCVPQSMSLLQIKDLVTEFVLQHVPDFNGIFTTAFNLDIDNFMHEVIRNLTSKLNRMRVIERKKGQMSSDDVLNNIECALKSAFYMHFRHLYNKSHDYEIDEAFSTAIFYFVREFCYASMFRYNRRGEFNVPYGGIAYNRKDFQRKINIMGSDTYRDQFTRTRLYDLDFKEFLDIGNLSRNDFVFVDPPYDSDFSTYTQNTFGRDDQIRLANYLRQCPAMFMLVIKNTEFINGLYADQNFRIIPFNKRYMVSFQNRNDKNAEHLMIMNY